MYGAKKVIFIIFTVLVLLAAGIGGYWFYATADARTLKDTDNWITFSGSGYSVRLPKGLKEGPVYTPDPSFRVLDCVYDREVCFAAAVADLTPEQAKVLKTYSLIEIAEMVKTKINGHEMLPVERGNYVYTAFHQTQKGMFPTGNEVYILDSIFATENKLYSVVAVCPMMKHPEYDEYLFKILDSFRPE